MQCGSKCFRVEIEVNGEQKEDIVRARTSVNARKAIREKYGKEVVILSAIEGKK